MATYNNWGTLKLALQKEMRKALQETVDKAYEDTLKWNNEFYSGGIPRFYHRIGMFGVAAKKEPIQGTWDNLSAVVGRDGDYNYETGSNPSGWTVFKWAEEHEAGIVGLSNTWERTEKDIEKDLERTFKSHFKKS